jgi:hypothetical protein
VRWLIALFASCRGRDRLERARTASKWLHRRGDTPNRTKHREINEEGRLSEAAFFRLAVGRTYSAVVCSRAAGMRATDISERAT